MSELRAKEYRRFEEIKQVRNDGTEFWSARELAVALDYNKWENFAKVIKSQYYLSNHKPHIPNKFY